MGRNANAYRLRKIAWANAEGDERRRVARAVAAQAERDRLNPPPPPAPLTTSQVAAQNIACVALIVIALPFYAAIWLLINGWLWLLGTLLTFLVLVLPITLLPDAMDFWGYCAVLGGLAFTLAVNAAWYGGKGVKK